LGTGKESSDYGELSAEVFRFVR